MEERLERTKHDELRTLRAHLRGVCGVKGGVRGQGKLGALRVDLRGGVRGGSGFAEAVEGMRSSLQERSQGGCQSRYRAQLANAAKRLRPTRRF